VDEQDALGKTILNRYQTGDWSKAYAALGWQPVLPLPEALDYTLDWYQREAAGARARDLCLEQIISYSEKAAAAS